MIHFCRAWSEKHPLGQHLLYYGPHLRLSQEVTGILVPLVEDFSQLSILFLCPLGDGGVRLIDTEGREEVLGHDRELVERELTVLVGVVLVKELLETLDDLFLL